MSALPSEGSLCYLNMRGSRGKTEVERAVGARHAARGSGDGAEIVGAPLAVPSPAALLRVTWISPDDNDPVRFWAYVIAGLQSVREYEDVGNTMLAALSSSPLSQPPSRRS